ncbi:hypothetical protein ACFL1R_09175 [Candidatus Latescibacterota bacterium]
MKNDFIYMGKIDSYNEFQNYLEDLDVVLFRTEKKVNELDKELTDYKQEMDDLPKDSSSRVFKKQIERIENDIEDIQNKQKLVSTVYVGFIINPKIDSTDFIEKVQHIIDQYQRYKISI